eukprot:4430560-Pyramimonas_sp.AAC.1
MAVSRCEPMPCRIITRRPVPPLEISPNASNEGSRQIPDPPEVCLVLGIEVQAYRAFWQSTLNLRDHFPDFPDLEQAATPTYAPKSVRVWSTSSLINKDKSKDKLLGTLEVDPERSHLPHRLDLDEPVIITGGYIRFEFV